MNHECVIPYWHDIPGYEGRYQINKDGLVRAFYKYGSHNRDPHYKLLKQTKTITLSLNKVKKKYNINYLLELCFGKSNVVSLDGEIWMPIHGYEGYYKISNMGRILSDRKFIHRKNGVKQFKKEQLILCNSTINSGYKTIILRKNGTQKTFLVHRLVAEHFVENPFGYNCVNHKDEDKTNNAATNLEWCTVSYNNNYGDSQERRVRSRRDNNNGSYGYKRIINR